MVTPIKVFIMEVKQEIWYRVPDVMKILGIKRSTVWLWAKQGKLKPIKQSIRVTVFRKSDVDAYMKSIEEGAL